MLEKLGQKGELERVIGARKKTVEAGTGMVGLETVGEKG